jgi:hypothetical protein
VFLVLGEFRYKREEVKIQAWENHEKRKAEMEMKKIEVWLAFLFRPFSEASFLLQTHMSE